MSITTDSTEAARVAREARMTRAEASTLADARVVLAAIERRSRYAGSDQVDGMRGMNLGAIAEAASVAGDVVANVLICAHVYNDDANADYGLKRDRVEAAS